MGTKTVQESLQELKGLKDYILHLKEENKRLSEMKKRRHPFKVARVLFYKNPEPTTFYRYAIGSWIEAEGKTIKIQPHYPPVVDKSTVHRVQNTDCMSVSDMVEKFQKFEDEVAALKAMNKTLSRDLMRDRTRAENLEKILRDQAEEHAGE